MTAGAHARPSVIERDKDLEYSLCPCAAAVMVAGAAGTVRVRRPASRVSTAYRNVRADFCWGSHEGKAYYDAVTTAYNEVIHWRRNVFLVPSGTTGKAFVSELARLMQSYADGSSLESIAMKAGTIAQTLLLQKPNRKSKSKEHVTHLQRRLKLWHKGDIQSLLEEGRCMYSETSPYITETIR